uniref:Uncharacterized protein n=1 Tax=viral metagenome TaxID=1070528 RepID=A0A6C0DGV7_9ZZZZ
MNTIHIIIKKILNIKDDKNSFIKIDNDCHENETIINYHNLLSSKIFMMEPYSIENKFKFFYNKINNIFTNDEISENFIHFFYKIQKIYNAFSRFAYLYKIKKAKIIIDTDLCLNKLRENDKTTYCLIQDGNKYLFNIHDLIKIIHNAISNTNYFFNNPLPIKNPYNNVYLNKSTLYNIYFFIREKTYLNADLLFYFFKTNFNITLFTEKYQYLIRDYSINNYLNNTHIDKLLEDIFVMIDVFNAFFSKKNSIIIHECFPKDILLKVMKPYLHLYYLSEYSLLHVSKRMRYKKILRSKLYNFQIFNPCFGRKFIKIHKKFSNGKIKNITKIEFNTEHIAFNDKKKEKQEFLKNHNSKYDDSYDYDYSDDDADDVPNGNELDELTIYDYAVLEVENELNSDEDEDEDENENEVEDLEIHSRITSLLNDISDNEYEQDHETDSVS